MKITPRFSTVAFVPAVILAAAIVATTSAKAPVSTGTRGNAGTSGASKTPANLSAAADYALPWHSFNGGGAVAATSPTHGLGYTIGESAVGRGSSPDYALEIGFLAGAEVCRCPHQGDFDLDGFVTALDLGSMIDALFAGQPDLRDPDCPTTRLDFHCDGFSDAPDLGGYIDYIFAGGNPPCAPCDDF